jgi:imidazole glycerol-phosphate synthase subunit HisH
MNVKVGVIDYGMGNLHSVAKALSLQGGRVFVSDKTAQLKKSDLLVLPGVGAFGAAMQNLKKKGLDRFVQDWCAEDKPYLGICLGFQLLFDKSEEDKNISGLKILTGDVVSFKKKDFRGKPFNIPHMGWNTLERRKSSGKLFSSINGSAAFYFVHTYFPEPKDARVIQTETTYGRTFCSSVSRGNLFATQFHPEKSGAVGLQLLNNVLKRTKRQ